MPSTIPGLAIDADDQALLPELLTEQDGTEEPSGNNLLRTDPGILIQDRGGTHRRRPVDLIGKRFSS